jgi:hypothetical protein
MACGGMWPPRSCTSCHSRGLAGRGSRDASPLSPVQACAGRLGAAGSSPSGAARLLHGKASSAAHAGVKNSLDATSGCRATELKSSPGSACCARDEMPRVLYIPRRRAATFSYFSASNQPLALTGHAQAATNFIANRGLGRTRADLVWSEMILSGAFFAVKRTKANH